MSIAARSSDRAQMPAAPICPKFQRICAASGTLRPLAQCTKRCKAACALTLCVDAVGMRDATIVRRIRHCGREPMIGLCGARSQLLRTRAAVACIAWALRAAVPRRRRGLSRPADQAHRAVRTRRPAGRGGAHHRRITCRPSRPGRCREPRRRRRHAGGAGWSQRRRPTATRCWPATAGSLCHQPAALQERRHRPGQGLYRRGAGLLGAAGARASIRRSRRTASRSWSPTPRPIPAN